MRHVFTLPFLVSLLAAPPAIAQQTYLAHGIDDDIRAQIASNWNVDPSAVEACGQPIELRVNLRPDGTVIGVEELAGNAENTACHAAVESARRAVLRSSPLRLPPGSNFPSIRLRFNADPTQE